MNEYHDSPVLKCDKCQTPIDKSGDRMIILKMELRYSRRNLCERCSEIVLDFVDGLYVPIDDETTN
jgi:hypothetical protein